jgi:hypothetical protein
MSVVSESFKNNPGKYILGSAGSIIAIVTALFAIDARYAHAADVEKDKAQTQKVIKDTAVILRKQALEDKLFEYDVKKAQAPDRKLSPIDTAMQERYKRQLDDLKSGKSLD